MHRERQATADPTREVDLEGGTRIFFEKGRKLWHDSVAAEIWVYGLFDGLLGNTIGKYHVFMFYGLYYGCKN